MGSFHQEVESGNRFEFGKNWSRFLSVLDDERIAEAERSLKRMLEMDSLEDKTFVDIGSGSGLFSLAARKLGATVSSFDYDPSSVACTRELKRRYFPDDPDWTVAEGSVLDKEFVGALGTFDITYSWGVLHHTGAMWEALDNVVVPVKPGGLLFIYIYEDRGWNSKMWHRVKRTYCANKLGRIAVLGTCVPYFAVRALAEDVLRGKSPAERYRTYKKRRGMSMVHDWVDWLGGYPYEFATPEQIIDFYTERGFSLRKIEGVEYVFERNA